MTFRFSSFADDKSTVRHPKYEDFVKFNLLKKTNVFGQEPWSSGYGGFESRHRILDGHLFTYKRPKINEKEAGVGPFFVKTNAASHGAL